MRRLAGAIQVQSGAQAGGAINVSVLIATYGTEDWRELAWSRAYPSAAAQSEDVQCFHDPEGTIASVRNELAASAKGDWLLFLDADDEIAPGYLDAMRAAHEQDRGDGPLLLTPAINIKGRFYKEGPIEETNWLVIGTLVQRDLFNRVGGFSDLPHGFEDWQLWLKCSKAGARIVKVPNAVYRRYVNATSVKSETWGDAEWQVATHNRILAELFPES
jgi:glycosyltransferase involved in cell wall biosynthesis